MEKYSITAKGPELGMALNREVKMIPPELIEDYLTIYLNAYPAFKNIGDEGREKYRNRLLGSMANDKNINFYGLYEDGKLIALMKLIDFQMNAFGKMQKACGLMSLAVHPMHKKKGAGRDMVRFFEKYTEETGCIVAMLLPFRMDFYRNMGYGYGTKLEEYHIPTTSLPACEDTSKIRFLEADELPEILKFQAEFASKNHGLLEKFEDEIRDMKGDSDSRRIGYVEDGKLRGYAVYNFVNTSGVNYTLNKIEVNEFTYDSPEVLRALLGYLRNQSDLAQSIVIRTGEEDFYHILPSAQDVTGNYIDFGFLQTNIGAIGTMYKVLDPKFFVEATSYRKFVPLTVAVGFDYYDELRHEDKVINLKFEVQDGGKASKWTVLDDDDACDVRAKCNLADLSSLFMGSAHFSSLVRLGTIKLSDMEYEDVLDALFYCKQKPWTNTDY